MTRERKSISKRSPKRRKRRLVLMDSGPLLLMGSYNGNLIGRFKRVRNYKRDDFDLLVEFLAGRMA